MQVEAVLKRGATAVFAYADEGAIKIIDWCASKGIRVPEDIAVVGSGDRHILRRLRPTLTTVRQDFGAMTNKALDILLDRIKGRLQQGVWQHEILDVELVIRQSCGAKSISSSSGIGGTMEGNVNDAT